jgi:hypothetical protein
MERSFDSAAPVDGVGDIRRGAVDIGTGRRARLAGGGGRRAREGGSSVDALEPLTHNI